MIRAISAQAASRFERTTSDTSSMTAIRTPSPPSGRGTGTTRQRSPGRGSSSSDTCAAPKRSSAARTAPHRLAREDVVQRRGLRRGRRPARGRRVREQHAPVLADSATTPAVSWESSVASRSFSRDSASVCSFRLRDMERNARTSSRQLLVRRLGEVRREVSARDRARSLDEIGHRPRDANRQAPGDRGGKEEHEKAERRHGGRQLSRLGLRDSLLRQQEQREQQRAVGPPARRAPPRAPS